MVDTFHAVRSLETLLHMSLTNFFKFYSVAPDLFCRG